MGEVGRVGRCDRILGEVLFEPVSVWEQLAVLGMVVGVEAQRLREMLPPVGVRMKLEPPRLCGACYAESPCHKIELQFQQTQGCEKQGLRLRSECPHCGARFKVSALWVDGQCQHCFLEFGEMVKYQKYL